VDRHIFLPYMSEKAETLSRRTIESRMKKLDGFGAFDAETEPEMDVEVMLDGGIIYGVIDSVQHNGNGIVLIRDWKTNIHDYFVPRYERQMQFYAYALRLRGKVVSKAEIIDVAASAKQNGLVGRQVDISEGAVSRLISALQRSLRGIASNEYAATPNKISCSCCDMNRLCPERYNDEYAQPN
jgi:DNA helicase-2/ATP-dependent DNA helicase PcrA